MNKRRRMKAVAKFFRGGPVTQNEERVVIREMVRVARKIYELSGKEMPEGMVSGLADDLKRLRRTILNDQQAG